MEEFVATGADLAASVDTSAPAETAAPAGDGTASAAPETDGATAADLDLDTETDELEDLDAPEGESAEEELPAEDLPAEEPPAKAADEELPPGVQMKVNAEGKKKFYLPEPVYKDFQGAVELRAKAAEILGEDVTPAALELRQNALIGQEKLYADLLSGDPKVQANVVRHFLQEAKTALENGEVGTDPMLGFADAMLETLAAEHPDADARVLSRSTRRVFDDVYQRAGELADGRTVDELQAAAKTGDASAQRVLNLLYSAQHLDKEIFGKFKKAGDLQARTSDPLAIERERLDSRRAELDKRDAAAATERWRGWQTNTKALVRSAVDEGINTALAEAQKQYAKYPNLLKQVADNLRAKVTESIGADARWNELIRLETAKAHRATSDQIRQQTADSIVNKHANKARQIVAAHRDKVLREAVSALKAQSDATHQRREAAAQHRAPGGGGTPVKRSIAPVPGGDYEVATVKNLMGDLDRLSVGR